MFINYVFTYENSMASLRFKPCLICHQSNGHVSVVSLEETNLENLFTEYLISIHRTFLGEYGVICKYGTP